MRFLLAQQQRRGGEAQTTENTNRAPRKERMRSAKWVAYVLITLGRDPSRGEGFKHLSTTLERMFLSLPRAPSATGNTGAWMQTHRWGLQPSDDVDTSIQAIARLSFRKLASKRTSHVKTRKKRVGKTMPIWFKMVVHPFDLCTYSMSLRGLPCWYSLCGQNNPANPQNPNFASVAVLHPDTPQLFEAPSFSDLRHARTPLHRCRAGR